MKRILLLLVMMLSFAGANAQKQGFISTGQNVNVRTGPGKQYPLAKEDFSEEPCQLDKGMLVRYLGKKKNGFCYVEGSSIITEYYCKGWVSAKYLRPVRIINGKRSVCGFFSRLLYVESFAGCTSHRLVTYSVCDR